MGEVRCEGIPKKSRLSQVTLRSEEGEEEESGLHASITTPYLLGKTDAVEGGLGADSVAEVLEENALAEARGGEPRVDALAGVVRGTGLLAVLHRDLEGLANAAGDVKGRGEADRVVRKHILVDGGCVDAAGGGRGKSGGEEDRQQMGR